MTWGCRTCGDATTSDINRGRSRMMIHIKPRRGPALRLIFALFALTLAPAGIARGQATPGPDGTVTAIGTATVERKPDVVRMQVELSAEGKDVKEALASLKSQEKAVREKLA